MPGRPIDFDATVEVDGAADKNNAVGSYKLYRIEPIRPNKAKSNGVMQL